jgi:hypothetical protein
LTCIFTFSSQTIFTLLHSFIQVRRPFLCLWGIETCVETYKYFFSFCSKGVKKVLTNNKIKDLIASTFRRHGSRGICIVVMVVMVVVVFAIVVIVLTKISIENYTELKTIQSRNSILEVGKTMLMSDET